MKLKNKIFLCVLNLIFANVVIYAYFSFSIRSIIIISILSIVASFFVIMNHQKLSSSKLKCLIDVLIACATTMLFLFFFFGIFLLTPPRDPTLFSFASFLMLILMIVVGIFSSIIAWLPWGIFNYFFLKFLLENSNVSSQTS